jgi:hypothetical protein
MSLSRNAEDGDGPVHGRVGTRREATGHGSGAQPGMAVPLGRSLRIPDDQSPTIIWGGPPIDEVARHQCGEGSE